MTNPERPQLGMFTLGMFVAAGMSAGALTGLVIGLLVRRPSPPEQMSETVEDLKRRAELILSELSKDPVPKDPVLSSGDQA